MDLSIKLLPSPGEADDLSTLLCVGAGAVFHIHSRNAVMVTLLFPGNEFRISHQQMIKAIVNCKTGKNYRYDQVNKYSI